MTEDLEQERRSRSRRGWVAVAGFVVAAAGAVWVVTPDAVDGPAGGVAAPAEVGETIWIGLARLVDDPITVRAVDAVTEAEAQVVVCHRVEGQDVIGNIGDHDLGDFCERTEPVVEGTRLEPNRPGVEPEAYVLVGLTATQPATQVYCGLDLRYRVGPRFGRTYPAGAYQAVLNPTHEDQSLHLAEDCPDLRR